MKLKAKHPDKALTAQFVKTATQEGKHFDGNGLYLRIASNGAKQWVQRIVIRGKRSEIGLGGVQVSLAAARAKALANRELAKAGGDPLAKAIEALTFAQAMEKYLAIKLAEFRNHKHAMQWRSTLDNYALPVIGRSLVDKIEVRDILRILQPIWSDKTETASRLRGRLEAILSWATVAGYRAGDNPARWGGNLAELLPKPNKVAKGGNHPALALSDMPFWWQALSERDGMAANALAFLTLTLARSGEVRGMTWGEVDLEAALWTVPAARMKMKREHRVPLTAEALALLKGLHHKPAENDLVFYAPRGGMLSDMTISAVMRRMQDDEISAGRLGFLDPRSKRPAVPHGIRSSFRDWAAEQGIDRDMAEMALAHSVGDATERAYRRTDFLERRRGLLASWGRFVRGEAGAKVVALREGA